MTKQNKSSYLEYLPAVSQEDPFLGQFLLPFEKVLQGFGDLLSTIDRYFAPTLTDADFLPWLATWVALVMDETWDETKRRQLISQAVSLYRERGTVQGLKHYLEIYTGLSSNIRECRWPGGMQIGIASQIGERKPLSLGDAACNNRPSSPHDYYVVHTIDEQQRPIHLYYRADRVERVEVGDSDVIIRYYPPGDTDANETKHEPATVTRRDGLILDCFELELSSGIFEYLGNTCLIDEMEKVYRFVLEVPVSSEDIRAGKVKLDKVRAIVDLEKPAHTLYYLKLATVVREYVLLPMQVGVEEHAKIGVNTTIG